MNIQQCSLDDMNADRECDSNQDTTHSKKPVSTQKDKLHELEYSWNFSFKPKVSYKQQSERDWLSDYKTVSTINTVETFWGVYNNIPALIDMPHGSIYAMFRDGIHPSWEHSENKDGFSWVLYFSKNTSKEWINKLYENSLMLLIGCTFQYEELLNGCTFERKLKGDKFVFWFKETHNKNERLILESLIKDLMLRNDEYKILDDRAKIEWKNPELKHKKVCMKIVRHSNAEHQEE